MTLRATANKSIARAASPPRSQKKAFAVYTEDRQNATSRSQPKCIFSQNNAHHPTYRSNELANHGHQPAIPLFRLLRTVTKSKMLIALSAVTSPRKLAAVTGWFRALRTVTKSKMFTDLSPFASPFKAPKHNVSCTRTGYCSVTSTMPGKDTVTSEPSTAPLSPISSEVPVIATLVAVKGTDAAGDKADAIDDLKVVLKENIELGQVVRVEAAAGNVIDSYVHRQDGRGVNGVVVELSGGTAEIAHDVAVHIAFAKPTAIRRDEVPEAEVAAEREALTAITRAEGKPEAALDKIVEGRLGGWFKDRVLLEQGFVKDEKTSIEKLLGGAEVVRFAQVVVGG